MPYHRLLALGLLSAGLSSAAEAQDRRAPRADAQHEHDGTARDQAAEHRAAIGVGTTATGTARDTLGVLVTSITRGGPAERAGLEEGNRISAINGVSLKASAADAEDLQYSGTLTHRLTRELGKVKPGDEVELRVYRDGRASTVKVRTADSDSLFRRHEPGRMARRDWEDRPTLGVMVGSSGSRRDTLGVLIMGVPDSTPAARAGLEEGNRIAAINGVSLRVAREDAGDPMLGNVKAQRLQREVAQLTPGSDATLRVYANGQFRDVRVKVSRAGELPRHRGMMITGGMGGMDMPMPALPPVPGVPPMPPGRAMHIQIGPEIRARLQQMRYELERVGPEFERMRPQIERALLELPRLLDEVRIPDINIDVDASGGANLVGTPRAPRRAAAVRTTVM